MKSYLGINTLPRGLRNNNPGNEIITNNGWLGKIPLPQNTDGHFEQFDYLENGIRVAAYQIVNDVNNGYDTIAKLITYYAPPIENNTNAYITRVANATGIDPNTPLVLTDAAMKELLRAIFEVENGPAAADYISDSDIYNGIYLLPAQLLQQITMTAKKNAPLIIGAFFLVGLYLVTNKKTN